LSHVGVPTTMLVLDDTNLNQIRFQEVAPLLMQR